MIKVLHITARSDMGGGPRHIEYLIKEISSQVECFVACPEDKPFFYIFENIVGKLNVYKIPHRKVSFKKIFLLHKKLKSENILIVHCHGKGASAYGKVLKLLRPNIKLVYTPHGIHVDSYNFFTKKLYLAFEKLSGSLFDHIIYVSASEKLQAIKEKIFLNNSHSVTPNGVPYNIKKTDGLQNNISKKTIGLDHKKKIIISLSRFDYQKNMFEGLDVVRQLPEYNFIWLGDGPDFNKIKEVIVAEAIPNLFLLGSVNNPLDYLKISDLYLSTSRWEGMPLSLLEAMSVGIAIVASDVSGNRDVVKKNTGALYELYRVDDCVKKIKDLFHNPIDSSSIINYFLENHTSELMAKKNVEIYKKLSL